jgi:RNA polymerase sigma-70 factor (ECF subfamily)
LQDVFIVVHRRWQDFQASQGSFRSWLFGILFRVAKDYRRALARKATQRGNDAVDPDSVASASDSPHKRAELSEQMQVLHTLLGELDDKKRTLLVMAELEQMTAPEIANALAIPLNTVYSRLRTARLAFELVLTRYRDARAAQ